MYIDESGGMRGSRQCLHRIHTPSIGRYIYESLGYKVTKLDRVQFAGLTKKNVRRGDWRYLTEEEVDRLRMGAYE